MKFILTLLFLQFLLSCSKGTKDIPSLPVNDSIYVTRILQIHKVDNDTSFYDFKYDDQKRCINMYKLAYNTVTHKRDSVFGMSNFYTGSSTQPSKVVMTNPFPNGDTRTVLLTYDNQNRIIRDSAIYTQAGIPAKQITHTYTYNAGGYTDAMLEYSGGFVLSYNVTVTQVKDAQGDIRSEGRLNPQTSLDVTYDQHPNPLYNLSLQTPNLESNIYPSVMEYFITPQKKNLLRTSKSHYPGGVYSHSEVTNYQIFYRADGYPLEIHAVSIPYHYKNINKYVFVYTKL